MLPECWPEGQKNLAKCARVTVHPDACIPAMAANVVAAADVIRINAKFGNVGEAIGAGHGEVVLGRHVRNQPFSNGLSVTPGQLRIPEGLRQHICGKRHIVRLIVENSSSYAFIYRPEREHHA